MKNRNWKYRATAMIDGIKRTKTFVADAFAERDELRSKAAELMKCDFWDIISVERLTR